MLSNRFNRMENDMVTLKRHMTIMMVMLELMLAIIMMDVAIVTVTFVLK